jgi:hypothetical protein
MHQGTGWRSADRVRAEMFYASLGGYTKLFFDMLMDRPRERISADQIAAYFAQHDPRENGVPDRRSVAASLTPIRRPYRASGRRLPFEWWRGANGAASLYGMKPTVARLFCAARMNVDPSYVRSIRGPEWTDAEVRATVADYLEMLAAEASGEHYSKAVHRRKLRQQLNVNRTDSSIEFKYQNISAAMLELGLPYIRGYKPRSNYQTLLATEIQRRIETAPALLTALRAEVKGVSSAGQLQRTARPATAPKPRQGRHVDYGLLQEENTKLGTLGEQLVVDYERDQLRQGGRPDLADRVRWTAKEDGDGLGYDVRSFDVAGNTRYIEVKTTSLGRETPFYISSTELIFAQCNQDSYGVHSGVASA